MGHVVRQGLRAMAMIGTHDGAFHCDEALGCWMLKRLERFKRARITRTRNAERLGTMDVVLDVGGEYDPERLRFDHHQRGFNEVFGHGHHTKLSTAGLIYKHFGKEILQSILHPMGLNGKALEAVYLRVYKGFVEAIDGIDNGVTMCEGRCPALYADSTGLSSRVGRLNPAWNETDAAVTPDGQFQKAMELCGEDFSTYVLHTAKTWLPARVHVEAALAQRHHISDTGQVIVLETRCPWKQHLMDLEEEQGIEGSILYCVYGDDRDFRVQAVPTSPDSFECRLALPEAWRALRWEDLDRASGIEGCVFVHSGGFIGGNKTKAGAVSMALTSISLARPNMS